MVLKFQAPVPGEQPNITADGLATMALPIGPRVGVVYTQYTVTKAAGGAGVTSLPVLTDVASPSKPLLVKIDGKEVRSRLANELIDDNKLQDPDLRSAGSVRYYQAGALVATVNDANNTDATNLGLAANTATTAVFQVPTFFAEYWRKDVGAGEGLALPTAFQDGTVLPTLTIEAPIANNGGGAFSAWGVKFWFDFDGLQWPRTAGKIGSEFVKKGRKTKQYSVVGDFTVPITIPGGDRLMQFSLLLAAGDKWSRLVVKKNGTTIRDLTPDQLYQSLLDHGMNAAMLTENKVHCVFDLNDDTNASLTLAANDTFEVTLTLSAVAAAANMVILTETLGFPG